jgi:pimeloyl-ACP methyl ester carboxylesterase
MSDVRTRRASTCGLLCALLMACGSDRGTDQPAAQAPPAVVSVPVWRGELQSATDVALVTKAASDAAATAANFATLAGPAVCDVLVKSIVHATAGPNDEVTRISGALLIPQGAGCSGPFPLLAYARGTSTDRARTLADPLDRETSLLINMFAARGYAVVATDYLGYASSDFPYHPYLHAKSEATSVIDSIRAARRALAGAGVATSGKIFLAGYSQGGHAALAALREIERTAGSDITIAATGGMSGPYDLALTFVRSTEAVLPTLGDEGSPSPGNRVRFLLADVLAEIAGAFLNIGLFADLLAAQSVTDFRPIAPLLLCGGARDPTVSFANTTTAAVAFILRGANVTIVDIDQEAAFASFRPAPGGDLGNYHHRVVPPLCFQSVRERLFNVHR